jgi:hypothetical protein
MKICVYQDIYVNYARTFLLWDLLEMPTLGSKVSSWSFHCNQFFCKNSHLPCMEGMQITAVYVFGLELCTKGKKTIMQQVHQRKKYHAKVSDRLT